MRFCDKLSKQRKNNNLSQEQLADKLGVSRQAVSKWESGSSYPDMEKIIQICGILNCTLEDILDDGVIGNNHISKQNFNNYFQDVLKFITKTSNMFSSMNWKEKIKCVIEMFIIVIMTLVMGMIIYITLRSITTDILNILPFNSFRIVNFLSNIYIIGLIVIGVIIVLHLFRIRYLDYFITIEDKNVLEKTIEEPIEKKDNKYYIEKEKNKIIIRDPKHSSFSFFNLLGKVFLLVIKAFLAFMSIPTIITFVFLLFLSVVSLCHLSSGLLFLWIALALIGGSIIGYIVIYFLYNFIFSKVINFKITFITFIISLVLIGVGTGLSFTTILSYKHVDNYNDLKAEVFTEEINIDSNTYIYNHFTNRNIEFVIDNSLATARIEITCIGNVKYNLGRQITNDHNYYYIIEKTNLIQMYQLILNDFKNKTIREYDSSDLLKIKVYLSEDNYNTLKNNQNIYR